MSRRKHVGRALLGRRTAAWIVLPLCLTSTAWGQSSSAPSADRPTIGTIDSSDDKPWACPKRKPDLAPAAAKLALDKIQLADAWTSLSRDAYEQAGLDWATKGRHELAVALFSEAIALDPADASAYYYRGSSWFSLAAYDKAIDDYSAEIRLAGGRALSHYQRGLAYEKRGELGKALRDFRRRLDEAPTDAEADSAVARVLAAIMAKWPTAGLEETHAIPVVSEDGAFVVPVLVNGEVTLKFVSTAARPTSAFLPTWRGP